MANDVTARPIKIDTQMAAAAALDHPIHVTKVYWENPTTAGHLFQIVDPTTTTAVLLEGRCETDSFSQVFDFPFPVTWKDFRVIDLDSGTLWIYGR